MVHYWICMMTETGWSDWRRASKKRYEHAQGKWDYQTKTTEG